MRVLSGGLSRQPLRVVAMANMHGHFQIHARAHTQTRWEPQKEEQRHKKSGWRKLLRSCRAALDVFSSNEERPSA